MVNPVLVKDIMTRNVITVRPGDSLKDVVAILFKHDFDGVPVVDKERRCVGIITQYDLIAKSSGLHLPTLDKVFAEMPMMKHDTTDLKKSFQGVHNLKAKDIMNLDPLVVCPDDTAEVAARVFVAHHRVNPLPVVGEDKKVVGILSRYDIITLFDPFHFARALGRSLGNVTKHEHPGAEKEALTALRSMKKDFIVVSKWRTKFWLAAASLFFFAGFTAAFAWVIQITLANPR